VRFERACLQSAVSPPPTNWGPKTAFVGRLRNLTATLTAYIFGMKHDRDNGSSALTTTRGLLHRLKMSCTLVHKRLQTGPLFLPILGKFCFSRHGQASQTEISKQNSTTLCQTADGKSRKQSVAEQLRSPRKKWGQETFTFVRFFNNFET